MTGRLWDMAVALAEAASLEQIGRAAVSGLVHHTRAGAGAFILELGNHARAFYAHKIAPARARQLLPPPAADGGRDGGGGPVQRAGGDATRLRLGETPFPAWIVLSGSRLDTARLEEISAPVAALAAAAVRRVLSQENPEDPMAIMSHEMRTPLTSIKGYATSLLRPQMAEDQDAVREFARLIEEEADALTGMVAEILESHATTYGGLALSLEPVLLSKLVHEAVDAAQARDDHHRIVCSIPPGLPVIWADPLRLKQVLNNLLDNAVKYAVPGLVVVSCHAGESEVTVSIADEGPGLKPEHLNRLFERYFRVKDNGKRVAGTGLGLPLAHDIVERHGGRIWATSAQGEGTTVSFSIPGGVSGL